MTTTNFRTATMSLFLPHVFATTTNEEIEHVFSVYGSVASIDRVPKPDDTENKNIRVYVHFDSLTEKGDELFAAIGPNQSIRIYYSYERHLKKQLRYWNVLLNTGTKKSNEDLVLTEELTEEQEQWMEEQIKEEEVNELKFLLFKKDQMLAEKDALIVELQQQQQQHVQNQNYMSFPLHQYPMYNIVENVIET